MIIQLNSQNLFMQITVGAAEKYEPTEDILEVSAELDVLREKTNKFLSDSWGKLPYEEILKRLESDEDKAKLWKEFLLNIYNPELQLIINKIENLNRKYCKGFDKYIESKKQLKAKSTPS